MKNKTLCITLLASALTLSFSSCNKEEQINTKQNKISTEVLSGEQKARNEAYTLLRSIYKNAYDGELIDINKFESISIASGYISQDNLRSMSSTSIRNQSVEDVLSPEMMNIYRQMLSFISSDRNLSSQERKILLEMSSILGGEDRLTMENIIWSTDITLSAINRLNTELTNNEFRGKPNEWASAVGKFICNASTGGIGAVWGSMGGAIASVAGASAIVSGGVTIVVGIAVGAAISTLAC